ncbi:MAG: topoisomerase DNA-binding C4 zinc finger domain-containing protein [bacterium]
MPDVNLNVPCPKCRDDPSILGVISLVERVNTLNDSHFLGCSNYPRCAYTQEMPEYVKMVRTGAATLPGMEIN